MGQWHLVNKYTLEPVPIGINWLFNLLLGKLSSLFSLPVWTAYDASIFILTIVYVLLIYKVLKAVFPNQIEKRFGALLIALTSTNLVIIEKTSCCVTFMPITYFYAYTAAWNRFGGVAHQIAQNILSLLAIYLFSQILTLALNDKASTKTLFFYTLVTAVVLSALFTSSTFYVATDLFIFFVIACYYGLIFHRKSFVAAITISFILLAVPLGGLAWSQLQLLSHPFWQFVREWEKTRQTITIPTFLLSGGVITLLIPFGITSFLKKEAPLKTLGFVYAFLPIMLYFSPLSKLLQIPSFRLLQPPAYVFFGAIAIEGITVMTRFLGSRLSLERKAKPFYAILTLFLALQIPGLVIELRSRINEYYLNSHLNYFDREVFDGLMVLKGQTHDKNVLAVHTLESFVPVISGHSVYEGHATLTLDYKNKIDKTIAFYTRKMTPDKGRELLRSNNLGFVLWERRFGDPQALATYYPFLKVLSENPKLVIYTVH